MGTIKLPLCNRMNDVVSVHRILSMSSDERFGLLGINDGITERSVYRTLQKAGREFPILLERYQAVIKKHGLINDIQVLYFPHLILKARMPSLQNMDIRKIIGLIRNRLPGAFLQE